MEFARAVGPAGNVAVLDGFDLLVSNFGVMFFGDPVAAFAHMCSAASTRTLLARQGWRPCSRKPAVESTHGRGLSPPTPAAEGGPAGPRYASPSPIRSVSSKVLTAAGWAPPRLDKPDLDLDIAAGRGLEEAVVQATQIDAVNS